jgi:hypothetical protein
MKKIKVKQAGGLLFQVDDSIKETSRDKYNWPKDCALCVLIKLGIVTEEAWTYDHGHPHPATVISLIQKGLQERKLFPDTASLTLETIWRKSMRVPPGDMSVMVLEPAAKASSSEELKALKNKIKYLFDKLNENECFIVLIEWYTDQGHVALFYKDSNRRSIYVGSNDKNIVGIDEIYHFLSNCIRLCYIEGVYLEGDFFIDLRGSLYGARLPASQGKKKKSKKKKSKKKKSKKKKSKKKKSKKKKSKKKKKKTCK